MNKHQWPSKRLRYLHKISALVLAIAFDLDTHLDVKSHRLAYPTRRRIDAPTHRLYHFNRPRLRGLQVWGCGRCFDGEESWAPEVFLFQWFFLCQDTAPRSTNHAFWIHRVSGKMGHSRQKTGFDGLCKGSSGGVPCLNGWDKR